MIKDKSQAKLDTEKALEFLMLMYSADNMYNNLNKAMAGNQFHKVGRYMSAVTKALQLHGDKYRIQGKWDQTKIMKRVNRNYEQIELCEAGEIPEQGPHQYTTYKGVNKKYKIIQGKEP